MVGRLSGKAQGEAEAIGGGRTGLGYLQLAKGATKLTTVPRSGITHNSKGIRAETRWRQEAAERRRYMAQKWTVQVQKQ